MKNLLYKELKLVVMPVNYIFLLFGAMFLIPKYPYMVAYFYTTLAIFFIFLNARENNDAMFSSLLPIRKSDIVLARCLTVAFWEILQIVISIPFALVSNRINDNFFLSSNVAFFGISLGMFALFNAIYIPSYYKTGYKIGFFVPCIATFAYMIVFESLAHFPVIGDYLCSVTAEGQLAQLPVLAAGIIVFFGGMVLTCRVSSRRFERVNL